MLYAVLFSSTWAEGTTAPAVDQARTIYVLQQQIDELDRELARLKALRDPTAQQSTQSHWPMMQGNMRPMQPMAGMSARGSSGWTGAQSGAAALPDAESPGAELMHTYCSQCHAPPSPALHSTSEWNEVIARMRSHMKEFAAAGVGVKVPSESELQTLDAYLGEHARTN